MPCATAGRSRRGLEELRDSERAPRDACASTSSACSSRAASSACRCSTASASSCGAGETLGIMGRNGCGKSTLLKILCGIYPPDAGEVRVRAGITPILELGVGWNPELDAIDNVFLIGTRHGPVAARDSSAHSTRSWRFAELERFANLKLKHYSSGMAVAARLRGRVRGRARSAGARRDLRGRRCGVQGEVRGALPRAACGGTHGAAREPRIAGDLDILRSRDPHRRRPRCVRRAWRLTSSRSTSGSSASSRDDSCLECRPWRTIESGRFRSCARCFRAQPNCSLLSRIDASRCYTNWGPLVSELEERLA